MSYRDPWKRNQQQQLRRRLNRVHLRDKRRGVRLLVLTKPGGKTVGWMLQRVV